MSVHVRVGPDRFDPAGEATVLAGEANGAGALVTFAGLVRPSPELTALELQQHPTFTRKAITAFALDVSTRWSLSAVRIVHRSGIMRVGEPIVFVGAVAAHRREAFEAADCAMDWLKSNAPFWKREHLTDGRTRWIEPTERDGRDLARWSTPAEPSS